MAKVAPNTKPARIFIIGARYDAVPGAPGANAKHQGSGTAAVLELARLLRGLVHTISALAAPGST